MLRERHSDRAERVAKVVHLTSPSCRASIRRASWSVQPVVSIICTLNCGMIGDDRESKEGRVGDGEENFSHRWREKPCLAWQGKLQRMYFIPVAELSDFINEFAQQQLCERACLQSEPTSSNSTQSGMWRVAAAPYRISGYPRRRHRRRRRRRAGSAAAAAPFQAEQRDATPNNKAAAADAERGRVRF